MKKQVRENLRLRIEQPRAPGASRTRPAPRSAHPHARHCIGCPLIDVPYPHQLTRKRARLIEALAAYPELSPVEVPAVIPAPQRLGYRCRVKLVVRRHGDGVALGLYLPQSHRVMDISSCPVHPQRVNQVIQYLKSKIMQLDVAPYDERDDSGDLRYLDLRYSAARREVQVTLITRHAAFPQSDALARTLMRRFSFVTGVIQNINESRGNVIWGSSFRTLAGRSTLLDQIGHLKLVFPPGVFSQANPFTARKLYESVRAFAELHDRETVLDLYCGVGPISLYLAPAAGQVWGVDESDLAIATAKQNARRNGLGNCRFIGGDAIAALAGLKEAGVRFEVVIVNPPRKGIQAAALTALVDCNPAKLIYVSCDPRTLARDLARLAAADYRIVRIQPFDMFPQTIEVEAIALLEK
jgi:23S rRNA (uracil1939-C5)-methyltransferase